MAWTGYTTALCCKVSFSRPSARQFLGREGGCLPLENICTKTRRTVMEILWENHPGMCVTPREKSTCATFEEYENVPKIAPLYFMEDEVTWV